MKLHVKAASCHLTYGMTECYLLSNTSEQVSVPVMSCCYWIRIHGWPYL